MKFVLCNAFSINMLSQPEVRLGPPPRTGGQLVEAARQIQRAAVTLAFVPVTVEAARRLLETADGWQSAIGHADTAAVVAAVLDVEVPVNRVEVTLDGDTSLIVAQYRGPRLPEGATTLPEGATIEFWQVYSYPLH